MKHFKKVAFGAAALCCAAALSAQVTPTPTPSPVTMDTGLVDRTFGVIGTGFMYDFSNQVSCTQSHVFNDADYYMNVNDFGLLAPKNLFTTIGYNGTSVSLGAAKNFGKVYGSILFKGKLGIAFDDTTSTYKDSTDSDKYFYSDKNTNTYSTAVLIGINGFGIKAGFQYSDNNAFKNTGDIKDSSGNSSYTQEYNVYHLTPAIEVGYNIKNGKSTLKTNAAFVMDINAKEVKDVNDPADPADYTKSYSTVDTMIKLGVADVIPSGDVTHTLGANAYVSFAGKPKDTVVETDEYNHFYARLIPSYKMNYDKVPGLNLGLGVYCPIYFYGNSKKRTTDIDTTKWNYNDLGISPSFDMGLSYDVVPKKFTVSLGAGLDLPDLTWNFYDKSYSDKNDSENDYRESIVEWKGTQSSGALVNLSSGFTYTIADTVTFDCNYNVVGDLFTNTLNSKWAAGNGTNFWNTVNQVLVHQLSAKINVKF